MSVGQSFFAVLEPKIPDIHFRQKIIQSQTKHMSIVQSLRNEWRDKEKQQIASDMKKLALEVQNIKGQAYNQWCREGNFFQRSFNPEYPNSRLKHLITFWNLSSVLTIPKITITYDIDENVEVRLWFSIFYKEELKNLSKIFFMREYENWHDIRVITLKIQSDASLIKLINFLKSLNKKYGRNEFSSNILNELEKIFNFIWNKSINNKHLIPEYVPDHVNLINPLLTTSARLVNHLRTTRDAKKNVKSEKELHYYQQGENPNQHDVYGITAFHESVIRDLHNFEISKKDDWKATRINLYYGGNLDYRPPGHFNDTGFETIADYGLTQIHALVMAAAKKSFKKLILQDLIVSCENNEINIKMIFADNKTIKTRWITAIDFHNNQMISIKNTVHKLFILSFKKENPDDVEKNFKKEFSPEHNKWIEIIMDEGEIIGFNLFRLVKDNGMLTVKNEYTAVHPDSFFRGAGINILMFVPALAFAVMLKAFVKAYYIAISENSADLMRNHRSTYKYISPFMGPGNHRLANVEFQREVKVYDGRRIKEQDLLQPVNHSKNNLPKSFALQCARDLGVNPDEHEAVLASAIADEEFFTIESRKIENTLNFSQKLYATYIEQLATLLFSFIDKYFPLLSEEKLKIKRNLPFTIQHLPNGKWLFWTGARSVNDMIKIENSLTEIHMIANR